MAKKKATVRTKSEPAVRTTERNDIELEHIFKPEMGQNLKWKVIGDDIFFERQRTAVEEKQEAKRSGRRPKAIPGFDKTSIGEIESQYGEEVAVNLMGHILAHMRQFNNDEHTNHISTAISVMTAGQEHRVKWGVTQSSTDPYERLCAERGALDRPKLVNGTPEGEVTFEKPSLEKMYLMSGQHEGDVKCSCAYCRGEIQSLAKSPDIPFYALPVLEVPDNPNNMDDWKKLKVDTTGKNIGDLDENEVFKTRARDLLPKRTIQLPESVGSGKTHRKSIDIINQGMTYIRAQDENSYDFVRLTEDNQVEKLGTANTEPTYETLMEMALATQNKKHDSWLKRAIDEGGEEHKLEVINKKLVSVIKEQFEQYDDKEFGDLQKISVVITKAESGEWYVGFNVDGERTTSKPTTSIVPLMDSGNEKITEVYMMEFEPKLLEQEVERVGGASKSWREVTLPNYSSRAIERLYKNRPDSHDLEQLEMTNIPINDGSLSADQLSEYMWKGTMADLLPNPFLNPKAESSISGPGG